MAFLCNTFLKHLLSMGSGPCPIGALNFRAPGLRHSTSHRLRTTRTVALRLGQFTTTTQREVKALPLATIIDAAEEEVFGSKPPRIKGMPKSAATLAANFAFLAYFCPEYEPEGAKTGPYADLDAWEVSE